MPDGPRIGAADGGRSWTSRGAARAHELPVASARLTYVVPGSPVRQSPRLCARAHRGRVAGLRHADRSRAGWPIADANDGRRGCHDLESSRICGRRLTDESQGAGVAVAPVEWCSWARALT